MSGDVRFHVIETQRAQPFGNHARRALLAIGQFGVLMEIAPRFDESQAKRLGGLGDLPGAPGRSVRDFAFRRQDLGGPKKADGEEDEMSRPRNMPSCELEIFNVQF
jgi:hypothetical protein